MVCYWYGRHEPFAKTILILLAKEFVLFLHSIGSDN